MTRMTSRRWLGGVSLLAMAGLAVVLCTASCSDADDNGGNTTGTNSSGNGGNSSGSGGAGGIDNPLTNQRLVSGGTGTLVFADLPLITLLTGALQNGGPVPVVPCNVKFREGEYALHLNGMIYTPGPVTPPYPFTWKNPLKDGKAITDLRVFDNDAEPKDAEPEAKGDQKNKPAPPPDFEPNVRFGQYVILDETGKNQPTGTLYTSDNVFVQAKAEGAAVVNGGPVLGHNHSIYFRELGIVQNLSKMIYQGKASDGQFIFQQIDG